MIQMIKTYEECRAFAAGFQGDPNFSDPMLSSEEQLQSNLIRPIGNPDRYCVFGVYHEETLIGLFAFLVIRDEQYAEMLAGLSHEKSAYLEALQYLKQHFPGYGVDFVFNPGNCLLREQLHLRKADFEPEQQKMVLEAPAPDMDTTGIVPLSDQYAEQYCAIHNKDMYWTGEKVMQAQDRFHTFLAIRDGTVIGYIDVTCTFKENEPFDLLVLEEYRRMGYGRKLLAKALEANAPNAMSVLVDADNAPAIRLYASMGFAKKQTILTAHWTVPSAE